MASLSLIKTESITLFPYEKYIIMDCLLLMPQMKRHEIANHISNSTGPSLAREHCQTCQVLKNIMREVGPKISRLAPNAQMWPSAKGASFL